MAIPSNPTATTPHIHASSTGIGDVKTVARPEFANRMFITAKTGAARVTFDGTTPTAANGLVLGIGVAHEFPFGKTVKYAGDGVAGELDVLYVD